MTRVATLVPWLALVGITGCSQETATASLRSLDTVGEVSLVCLARDETGAFSRGVDRSECPAYEYGQTSPYARHLHALATQPLSGEVALVDLAASAEDAVIDFEPTQPGYSFMPVGAEPSAIVSTPGGVASFVGVRESGREGIFALPSSCIKPRAGDEPVRDIRSWPACRLPAAPGPMAMLVDPAVDDDDDPATPARVRATCGGDYVDPSELLGQSLAASRAECPADLAREASPGRRKVLVTLPSLSEIWVLDAQALLDREPGSFDACEAEERFPLSANVTDAAERIPTDLIPSSPSCGPVGFNHGPVPDTYRPWPVDIALDDEERVYLADSEAPVVHVLDAGDPCALAALPSLEPRSYLDPNAIISTRRVAVSPLTPGGKRYVYAIDNSTTVTAGTLMAFDVSPGSTDRTPIVRERSSYNPDEPPDRIAIGRDAADVEFVYQDFAEPTNGVAVEGVACDPDPTVPTDSPGAEYRPSSDLSSGANPRKLRGTFAFAALHTGQLAVIDVEDLDAACRRPATVNTAATEDYTGCKNDPPYPQGFTTGNVPTVSREQSCNIVAPHRLRGRSFFTDTSAALLAFPALTLDTGRSVTTDQSEEGRDFPKLLAARLTPRTDGLRPEDVRPEDIRSEDTLIVGSQLYAIGATSNPLDVDPALAERSSVLLSYEEPRAYLPGEDYTAIYEGPVRAASAATFKVDPETGLGIVDEGLNASFCSAGIQDMALTSQAGARLGVSASDQPAFARGHADYVQIVSDLLEASDPYWRDPQTGAQCGLELFSGAAPESENRLSGRPLCEQYFLPIEVADAHRDFRIVEASEDTLRIEPRSYDPTPGGDSLNRRRLLNEFAACCFPGSTLFQVRAGNQWVVRGGASGFEHTVTTDPTSLRCVDDCSPTVQRRRGRAYEISCAGGCPDASGRASVGSPVAGQDFACIVDSADDGIDPGEPGAECVFQNLTTRFAIYRGQRPSARDMRFRWQMSDGFTPLVISLTSVDRSRSTPQSLLPLPETYQLLVTDGSARGLTFVSTRNLGTISSVF